MKIAFGKNCQAYRLSNNLSDINQERFILAIPKLYVNIQSMAPEYTAIGPNGETAKLYKGFTTASGLQETMQIVVSGTNDTYRITGVEEWEGAGGKHYNLMLIKAPQR